MRLFYLSFLLIGILFISCNENPYVQDVSNQNVSLQIYDFYKILFDRKDSIGISDVKKFNSEIGPFFESYNTRIIEIGSFTDSVYPKKISEFINESWIQELYASVFEIFPNTNEIHDELEQAFKYYSYYFPEKNIPKIITYVGGVKYSVVIDEGVLAIGLDKYLGENYLMYKQMNIASFIRKGMYKEKLPVDCMHAIVETEFPNNFTQEYLLAQMLHHGRYMYFVKSMLPEVADSTLWGYSSKQIEYCNNSEASFWEYFVSVDNILFNTEYLTIKRFIDEGPFTPVFDRESPGRIGQWVGFKIIESYMKNNPQVTLKELFEISDPQIIMSNAKYNP